MPWRKIKLGKERHTRGALYNILDVLLNVIIIIAVVAMIRTYIVSPFEVEGNSMIPTLEDSQYIIINKFGYLIGEPNRGDVVVFHPPTDESKYYVKRIIGLPRDEIVIRDGKVFLEENGVEHDLLEGYLNERNRDHTFKMPVGSGQLDEVRYRVPDDHYFLLGDNRQGSFDSRSFQDKTGEPSPYVQQRNIAGRVWFVALPITKSHALETPEYGIME